MNEERIQTLHMVAAGKVSAADAAKLLEAVDATEAAKPVQVARFLRVRVYDEKTGKNKVNVNLPFSLVEVGLRMGLKFIPKDTGIDVSGINMEELIKAVKEGVTGKIVDVTDDDEGVHVEVVIE